LHDYESKLKLFGPLPTFQENLSTLEVLRRQLACGALPSEPLYEKRYPYIDRGLLEFMYAVPREQLVRPGQRRSLVRRALVGIVTEELLHRKRKAFVVRSSMTAISAEYKTLIEMGQHLESSSLGIVNSKSFQEVLQKVRHNLETPIVPIMRTISIAIWLSKLTNYKLIGVTALATGDQQLRNEETVVV